MSRNNLTNTQKIAAFLITLGKESTAQILGHLDPAEMEKIAHEIALMGRVPNQTKRTVLREFRALLHAEDRRDTGFTFAEEVLNQVVGSERARDMMQHIVPVAQSDTPPYLSTITAGRAAALLCEEPVHIIALLLSSVAPDCAAGILEAFTAELRHQVAMQFAHTTPPSPELRLHLEKALRVKAQRHSHEEQLHGQAALAEMGNLPKPDEMQAPVTEPRISVPRQVSMQDSIYPSDDGTLSFHELHSLAPSLLQVVVRKASNRDLCRALYAVDPLLHEAILSALPFARRISILHTMKSQPSLQLRVIADAQERIAHLANMAMKQRPAPRALKAEVVHV
ncbi:MAG: FliG C-terminal domain-containing protein [Armatimonadota bacterium]